MRRLLIPVLTVAACTTLSAHDFWLASSAPASAGAGPSTSLGASPSTVLGASARTVTANVGEVFRAADINFPINSKLDWSFGSNHVGGAHFLLTDGSVRFVSQNLDGNLYGYVASRNGGETVGDF